MNECARISALLDVYLDDETTPETNALVQQHLALCGSCAARLASARELRAALRGALRAEQAPAALHKRVHTVLPPSRPALAAFIRTWLVPAAATTIVALIVLPWRPAEPEGEIASAVGEHVSCALERGQRPRDAAFYRTGLAQAMPLVPDAGGRLRVVDAHTCGDQRDYQHIVLEEDDGTKASILIADAGEGAERIVRPQRRGAFDVSVVRTSGHRAFVVIDRTRSRALREWREPAEQRVRHFLKQVEGP